MSSPRGVQTDRSMPKRRSPEHAAFGVAIRELRRSRGISQEDLAYESRIHRTYVGGIERGERNPSLTNILRIAEALEVRASELLAEGERLSGNSSG